MAETMETTPETNETIPEKEEQLAEITPAAPEPTADPAPKKRGRPKGAPDKAPRKKKIVIEEVPITPPEPEPIPQPTVARKPKQKTTPEPTPREPTPPPSPRAIMREASRNILQLHPLRDIARKSHLMEAYTKNLHSLV
jgi:hypothetical protein